MKNKRREFDRGTKAEIKTRCATLTGWRCENCGQIVASGEIDHIIAEALIVDKTKKLTAKDGQFLCWPCHQGAGGKTARDKGIIAKAKRQEAANLGVRAKPEGAFKLQSRGFQKFAKTKRGVDKSALPPLPRKWT